MNLPCDDAQLSIMSYLDGELSEAQAAPLRKHLLECQPCRASAQDLKNTSRWFVRPQAVAVPRDFASRVARRAFQGDRGERVLEAGGRTALAPAALEDRELEGRENGRMLRFVLTLTSVAAAVAICVAIGIRSLSLPSGERLTADDRAPAMSLETALDELDALNGQDTARPAPPDPSAERGGERGAQR